MNIFLYIMNVKVFTNKTVGGILLHKANYPIYMRRYCSARAGKEECI